MAEEKKTVEAKAETPKVETVPKAQFDILKADYQRVVAAYNKLLGMVANEYADKLTKSIFDEIDAAAKK